MPNTLDIQRFSAEKIFSEFFIDQRNNNQKAEKIK